MFRVRHTDGPGRFAHASLDCVSTTGDTHEVSDAAAEYLCDELGYFERIGGVTDVDYREVDKDDDKADDKSLDEHTKDELYQRASEQDIDGRSSMTKDELIAALRED